jgi:hypothetical protein
LSGPAERRGGDSPGFKARHYDCIQIPGTVSAAARPARTTLAAIAAARRQSRKDGSEFSGAFDGFCVSGVTAKCEALQIGPPEGRPSRFRMFVTSITSLISGVWDCARLLKEKSHADFPKIGAGGL